MDTTLFNNSMTLIFAGMSGIFAGLSWYYSYLAYARDNPKIEATASKMKLVRAHDPQNPQDVIMFRAVNIGRRPVTLNSLYISFSKENHGIILSSSDLLLSGTTTLPKTIGEGEEALMIIDFDELVKSCNQDKKMPISITFSSSTNKNFTAKFTHDKFPEFIALNCFDKIKEYLHFSSKLPFGKNSTFTRKQPNK